MYLKLFTCLILWAYTAISRKVVGKNVTRQSRKVIWDIINSTVPGCSCRTYVCCFPLAARKHTSMASHAIHLISLKNSVLKTTHTIPFGIVACTLSDNLSRNSCIISLLVFLTVYAILYKIIIVFILIFLNKAILFFFFV